jgi:hypothetical protein
MAKLPIVDLAAPEPVPYDPLGHLDPSAQARAQAVNVATACLAKLQLPAVGGPFANRPRWTEADVERLAEYVVDGFHLDPDADPVPEHVDVGRDPVPAPPPSIFAPTDEQLADLRVRFTRTLSDLRARGYGIDISDEMITGACARAVPAWLPTLFEVSA